MISRIGPVPAGELLYEVLDVMLHITPFISVYSVYVYLVQINIQSLSLTLYRNDYSTSIKEDIFVVTLDFL